MKLLLALSAIPAALACLHTWGDAHDDALPGLDGIGSCGAVDNGLTVCSSDWGSRIDQDGHYIISCLPGYVYAFTKNGATTWYANPSNAFSWTNGPRSSSYCCYGACDDKGPTLSCTDYDWDKWMYCQVGLRVAGRREKCQWQVAASM
ncbi:hypothetical protein EJ02DRAFT_464434 [Clathrospora elynae]|uniref:Uncharacterized protein n=1 Tax=Clathrospora elynae TaxID=706981 RepID=A0A6A5T086_9PLEO|nr:hypothetical protein EJ02DRAFT_464434 [Clathrospora elynae]